MTDRFPICGIWLPLITPFLEGALDEPSLARLAQHYAREPIQGFIVAATTGEGLVLDEEETERAVIKL
jgi:4-hydroxy-tetrahydrodipicolinate synthase